MAIVTFSRELAALGDETALETSRALGYRLVDKQALEARIKAAGIPESKLTKYDERKPSFWASLSQDRDDYLHYLRGAVLAEAVEGNCVFVGRGAGAVLAQVPAVIPVFLVASAEIRIERVKSYFQCDEKRARQIIDQSDHDRSGFHRYFFDIEWKEPGNYQITLNTGHLHPSLCASLIRELCVSAAAGDAEEHHRARIHELALGHRVKHHILYEKEVPIHFLEAAVQGGQVLLYGVANSQSLVEAALAAGQEAAGSAIVKSEIQVVQEYNVIPQ